MLMNYLPVVIFGAVAVGFAALLLVVARLLGPKRESVEKDIPYECGKDPAGRPRSRFNVQFYSIAILYVVFDIEAAFFYPWAVMYRDLSCRGHLQQSGICQGGATFFGLGVMAVFLVILVLALLYVWRKRVLEWE
jgi:NADH-quinone oxidoreductase subunit A